jgi:hypothetical protein
MNLKADINVVRRKLMRSLTKNVGTSQFDKNIDLTKMEFKKIGFSLNNILTIFTL